MVTTPVQYQHRLYNTPVSRTLHTDIPVHTQIYNS